MSANSPFQHVRATAWVFGAAAGAVLTTCYGMAWAQVTPADSLAAQLRIQGHRCDEPVSTQRDAQQSRPDEAVWIIQCGNASYRVRLTPDRAARIEQLP
jgi:hypothetical protein